MISFLPHKINQALRRSSASSHEASATTLDLPIACRLSGKSDSSLSRLWRNEFSGPSIHNGDTALDNVREPPCLCGMPSPSLEMFRRSLRANAQPNHSKKSSWLRTVASILLRIVFGSRLSVSVVRATGSHLSMRFQHHSRPSDQSTRA